MTRGREREALSSTVLRALAVLDVLVAEPRGLGLSGVARRAGLSKATTFRLLGSLQRAGLVIHDRPSSLYRPGMKLVRMATQILNGLNLRTVSHRYAEALARETGHAVLAGVIESGEVVYIDIVPGSYELRVHTDLGQRRAVHLSSIGKAVLAFLPPAEREAIVAACSFERHTEHTITDRQRFLAHLEEVRQRGWALVRDEDAIGASSLSAPVFDAADRVVGAIGISVPTLLLDDAALARFVPLLRETCARASADLGQPQVLLEQPLAAVGR